jgi:hypothetical protein
MSTTSTRLAGVSGIGFVLLMLGRVFLSPDGGDPTDSAATIVAKVAPHSTGLLADHAAGGIAALLLVLFAAGLCDYLRERGAAGLARTAFGAVIALFAVVTIEHALGSALAYGIAAAGDHAVGRAFADADFIVEALARFPMALFVGATAVASLHTGALSRTLAGTGIAVAALQLVGGIAIGHAGLLALNGPASVLSLLAFVFWSLAVAISMTRRAGGRAAAHERVAVTSGV